MEKQFTFTFKGKNAEYLAERFSAYFWDGGLDQFLEQNFLEEFHLSLDNVEFKEGGAIIDTDNAKN